MLPTLLKRRPFRKKDHWLCTLTTLYWPGLSQIHSHHVVLQSKSYLDGRGDVQRGMGGRKHIDRHLIFEKTHETSKVTWGVSPGGP